MKPNDIQYMKTCHDDKHTDIQRLILRLAIRSDVLYNVTIKYIFIHVNGYRFINNSINIIMITYTELFGFLLQRNMLGAPHNFIKRPR